MYNEGVSRAGDVLDYAVEMDIVEKRGSFYSYRDERLAQGRENAKVSLRENPVLMTEIENQVREANGLPPIAMPDAVEETLETEPEPVEIEGETEEAEPVLEEEI
jgi:recombination protein RecA